jgi:hypothetical protein
LVKAAEVYDAVVLAIEAEVRRPGLGGGLVRTFSNNSASSFSATYLVPLLHTSIIPLSQAGCLLIVYLEYSLSLLLGKCAFLVSVSSHFPIE